MSERIPWQESNLALIGSDLDHKIKAAAAEFEDQWKDLNQEPGIKVWRIEQFKVVPWSEDKYGKFHKGDSYVVLNSYTVEGSDALLHDLHIWIGSESSQDEYGTAAYKMVEADDSLGGSAIQHREVQGSESTLFQSYFEELTYLDGGADTGFTHVEPTKDEPHLYRVKGTDKGLSLTQVSLSKSSLNAGDSFILFGNESSVFIWNGESANPHEKAKAISLAEKMCSRGTVTTLDQGQGDEDAADFWVFLGNGDIQEADESDEDIQEFAPLLFKVSADPDEEPVQVAKGELVTMRFGRPQPKLERSLLDESDVFILDAGWEVFVWVGSDADQSEKLVAVTKGDAYCKQDPRTANLPLTLVKSGWEGPDFSAYFQ